MSRNILTFILFFGISTIVFSLDTLINNTNHLPISSIAFFRSDTVFYADNKINYIILYYKPVSINENRLKSSFELQK